MEAVTGAADAPHEQESGTEPDTERSPLLLHSLAELSSLWQKVFDVAGVRTVTEVGSEAGFNTLRLAQWLAERGGGLTVVDPDPAEEVLAAAERSEVSLVRGLSPQALEGLDPSEAYLLDGDHNYATVTGELQCIFDTAESPLVILHDCGWPWARRDLYYNPEVLDAEQRHPYSYELGVAPGRVDAFRGGFRGEGEFAVALVEGGPRNGVRTAVEDFMTEREGLCFRLVPPVFGLGFLYRADADFVDAVESVLDPYADNRLLSRLEENRLELYVRVLELQDALTDQGRHAAALRNDLAAAREDLERRGALLAEREARVAHLQRLFDRREAERSARELDLLQRVADLERRCRELGQERDAARAGALTPRVRSAVQAVNLPRPAEAGLRRLASVARRLRA